MTKYIIFVLLIVNSNQLIARHLYISGFVGADEILYDLIPAAQKSSTVIYSPLARDPKYSAIYDLLPKEARTSPINLETIVALAPEMVFLAPYSRADIQHLLTQAKIPQTVLSPATNFEAMVANIQLVATLTNSKDQGNHLVAQLKTRQQELATNCQFPQKTFLNYATDGTLYGSGTSFDAIITLVGGINLAKKLGIDGWRKVSMESLATNQADVIVVAGNQKHMKVIKQELSKHPAFGLQKAVINDQGRIIAIENRLMTSVTHYLLAGAQQLCQQLKRAGE